VGKTKFYKDAIKDGSLKPFENSATSEAVLKEQEKLQALREEIKALQEKKELLKTSEEIIAKAAKKAKE
jgi:cell division protein FtsB